MTPKSGPVVSALLLIAGGLLAVALLHPDFGSASFEHFVIGVLLGTMFGQAVLAGAWAGLGPLRLWFRVPLSLIWIVAIALALLANEDDIILEMLACMLGIWLVAGASTLGLATFFRFSAGQNEVERHRPLQFGIRQLMILTAAIAVLLAIGRLVAPALTDEFRDGQDLAIFVFLAVAGVLTNLPLVLAVLLPSRAAAAVLAGLLLNAFWTMLEFQLTYLLFATKSGPDFDHLVWINTWGSFWGIALPLLMRQAGYRLRAT